MEVAHLEENIGVRDSKATEAPHLVLGRADWQEFARRVKHGEHDLP